MNQTHHFIQVCVL